jgi:spore germination protein GerM
VTRRPLRLCALLAAVAVAGCGVPVETAPRSLPPVATASGATPASTPGSTSSARPGSPAEVLFLVRGGRLVAVRRPATGPLTPQAALTHLFAGPTAAEHDAGMTSALTGIGTGAQVRLDGSVAVVDLGGRPEGTDRSDEILAYGQVVCTLVARPEVDAVSFLLDGRTTAVPRADGSLTWLPVSRADYATLVTHG